MVDCEQIGQARNRLHRQSGQSTDGRQQTNLWDRRVGTCLLPQISKPPGRLSQGMVERCELGRSGELLYGGQKVGACFKIARTRSRRRKEADISAISRTKIRLLTSAATILKQARRGWLLLPQHELPVLLEYLAQRKRHFILKRLEFAIDLHVMLVRLDSFGRVQFHK